MNDTYQIIPVTSDTSVDDVMVAALEKFGLDPRDINRHRLVEVSLEKGGELTLRHTQRIVINTSIYDSCSREDNGQSRMSVGNNQKCC